MKCMVIFKMVKNQSSFFCHLEKSGKMILQLNPALPVECPKGKGLAHFIIDEGVEHNVIWGIFVDETGEIWWYQNQHVRAQKNITMGRLTQKTTEDLCQETSYNPGCTD